MELLCLCMIVKNEERVVARCLHSVLPHVQAWFIHDTGSTDQTVQSIIDVVVQYPHVHGYLDTTPSFVDFSSSRNTNLDACKRHTAFRATHILFMDADMVLVPTDPQRPLLPPESCKFWRIQQYEDTAAEGTAHSKIHIMHADAEARYVGVTHEVLVSPQSFQAPLLQGWHILHRPPTRKRPEKIARDIRLLTGATTPPTDHTMYYLMLCYRDLHDWDGCLGVAHKLLLRAPGDTLHPEHAWYARYTIAVCMAGKADVKCAIFHAMACIAERPHRPEPFFLLVSLCRELGWATPGRLFADHALTKLDTASLRDEITPVVIAQMGSSMRSIAAQL